MGDRAASGALTRPEYGTAVGAVEALEALVRRGDRVLVASGAGEPGTLVDALVDLAARQDLDLEIVQIQTGSSGRVLDAAATGNRVVLPVPARGALPPGVEILPLSMFQLARAIADGTLRIDGVLFAGVPDGGDGVLPGLCVDVVPVAFAHARWRAVELDEGLPWVPAEPLPLGSCELVVHGCSTPAPLEPPAVGPAARTIGEYVAELVEDGAALEVGVGRALAGIGGALARSGVELSVHTGLASDWTRDLVEAGVACRKLDCAAGAPVLASVAMGSADFYGWLDGRPELRLVDSLHAHDPAHLMALGGFAAVNAATRVDLAGQVGVPEGAGSRRAVGGLLDFATAGAYAAGSIVAVESLDRRGRSQVVPTLTDVQLPSQLVTHVVTEHGVARLAGKTWPQRVREMIAVAHPDHRDELRSAAAG
jgi:acyl-CoA hydrolase